jgi:hypothetical protein
LEQINTSSQICRPKAKQQKKSGLSSRQVYKEGLAGFLSVSERLEGRAAHLDGRPIQIERSPRGYKTGLSVKAGTGAALEADHERKAVAARAPDFQILYGIDDAAELHDASDKSPPLHWKVLFR